MKNKIKCLVVDDSALARGLIENHISKFDDFQAVGACDDAVKAKDFLQQKAVDVIFCDIEMPGINGLDFIKNLASKPIVVMTTAYSEYALDGFEIGAIDYLLKPITFERFSVAVEKIKTMFSLQSIIGKTDFIFVKSNGKQIKILFADIQFIQSKGDYITFFLLDKKVMVFERMKNMIVQLPDNQFIRIHNSYIVNIHKVKVCHKEKLEIGILELPISEKYRGLVKNYFQIKNTRSIVQ